MKKNKHKYRPKVNKRKKKPYNRKSVNPNTKKIPLATWLNRIYTDTVNLDTTCAGRCECCKTAMPQMNFCEATQLFKEVWDGESKSSKIDIICTSIEYFFKHEFEKWGRDILVKPCMLLSEDGRCKYYNSRPLSCRLYGLWPEEDYTARVDKFERAFEGLVTREELPMHTQCPYVKRVDESVELTTEVINGLFAQLDDLDAKIGDFSELQIKEKENYRTFHDWVLLIIYGEEWLSQWTAMIMAADSREVLEDLLVQVKKVARDHFAKDMPKL